MNTKDYMQYDNLKKNKTTAYLLGALSWVIPLAFHKWYLGEKGWAVVYILLLISSIVTVGTMLSGVFSILYTVLLLVDLVKTSIDVDNYNNELIQSLDENDLYT